MLEISRIFTSFRSPTKNLILIPKWQNQQHPFEASSFFFTSNIHFFYLSRHTNIQSVCESLNCDSSCVWFNGNQTSATTSFQLTWQERKSMNHQQMENSRKCCTWEMPSIFCVSNQRQISLRRHKSSIENSYGNLFTTSRRVPFIQFHCRRFFVNFSLHTTFVFVVVVTHAAYLLSSE